MVERLALASGVTVATLFRVALLATATTIVMTCSPAWAQEQEPCRFICELEWKVEPTITIENLANRHRVVTPDGVTERVNRERVFEIVLALDMETRVPRLGFTVEAIASPFSDDNAVELEFESNLELDTALHVFNWLPEDRWLRGVEFETSLDYLATGIPKRGEVLEDGTRFVDDASHWSLSFVFVIPVAPF